jgi:predicted dehydrogenase
VSVQLVRVGVVGAGYWGPNLVRTLSALPGCQVVYVCDQRPGRLQYIGQRFAHVRLTERYEDLLADNRLDAIFVATPVATHRAVAEAALSAGKHVFVEKPLASSSQDALALVELSRRTTRILATGHLFVYHPAVVRLGEVAQSGDLGRLCYAESGRVNLGPPTSEVDVVWDLAVHDVSIVLAILGHEPDEVQAEGRRYIHPSLIDVAFLRLRFANGFLAEHHVSWLSPMKVRRFVLSGTAGSAIFDDTREESRLILCDRGHDSRVGVREADSRELFYRPGEVRMPHLEQIPPLTAECADFLECVRTGRVPRADGRAGLAVVRVLEAAAQSIETNCQPVRLAPAPAQEHA